VALGWFGAGLRPSKAVTFLRAGHQDLRFGHRARSTETAVETPAVPGTSFSPPRSHRHLYVGAALRVCSSWDRWRPRRRFSPVLRLARIHRRDSAQLNASPCHSATSRTPNFRAGESPGARPRIPQTRKTLSADELIESFERRRRAQYQPGVKPQVTRLSPPKRAVSPTDRPSEHLPAGQHV